VLGVLVALEVPFMLRTVLLVHFLDLLHPVVEVEQDIT
jgi:hypothetical protein